MLEVSKVANAKLTGARYERPVERIFRPPILAKG